MEIGLFEAELDVGIFMAKKCIFFFYFFTFLLVTGVHFTVRLFTQTACAFRTYSDSVSHTS